MAIINGSDVKGFQFAQLGRPFVRFEVNSTANTLEGGYRDARRLFIGASGVIATITTNNVYVKTPSGWQNAQEIYINVSGNWKRVTNDKFLVKTAGGPWRS